MSPSTDTEYQDAAPSLAAVDDASWQVPDFDSLELSPKLHDAVLVIPVLNEGKRIQGQLRNLAALNHPIDIIIADGGSTDGSLEEDFLRDVGVRARLTKTGPGKLSAQLRMAYAWALKQGYQGIVTVDGNGKDGMDAVPLFLQKLSEGYDYVQGSRYHPDGAHKNTPLERTVANRMIHAPMLSLASGSKLTDTTNGYRAYSASYLLNLAVQPFRDVFNAYELLFYLSVRAGQLGLRVTEVPVSRSYPKSGKTPTKIAGFSGKLKILQQTLAAALGRYSP
ncbi:glycosyltransferase family 2 protein (plasmid) [Ruegeria conchae]|uniref:glycosyltransferase family 2 protein n=1 Tax=Ruegeria conchae TaxID=981384 RepID=UPI00147AF12C|nr:glycosyltransferase family 2 protein [Ruegeria conchae]UWR05143.1 glycosyltransferase family 2 protein [Ruegeria conchae]